MTAEHEKSERRQVRGQKLRDLIGDSIRQHAEKASRLGGNYVYNASEIARDIGVARSTLLRNDDIVLATLTELRARRRFRDGSAAIESLKERNFMLQTQILEQALEIEQLHKHQADLYTRLIRHSIDVGALFCGYAADVSRDIGKCVLCGSPAALGIPESNIVSLRISSGRKGRGRGKAVPA